MDQKLNSEGICCTCSFRTNCLSYKNSKISGKAIMHCEEFDDLTANMVEKNKNEMQLQKDTGNTNDNLINPPIAKGICVNCDDADICKFAGFGDDVFFCEGYSSNFKNARDDKVSHKFFTNLPDFGVKNLIPGWDA